MARIYLSFMQCPSGATVNTCQLDQNQNQPIKGDAFAFAAYDSTVCLSVHKCDNIFEIVDKLCWSAPINLKLC